MSKKMKYQTIAHLPSCTESHHGDLHDYRTGRWLRVASEAEHAESVEAAKRDGGAGVIDIDGCSCYVSD